MRRFLNKRVLLVALIILALGGASAVGGVYVFVNSPRFNERIRIYLVEQIEQRTGAKATLGSLSWSLRKQRLVIENVTLRGEEPATEPPLIHVDSITAGLKLKSLLEKRLDLFELTVIRPQVRLLIDPSGKTNFPEPPKRADTGPSQFTVSIDNLKITDGSGLINERRINVDLTLANLVSDLSYRGESQVLSAKVAYRGGIARGAQASIPYDLTANVDLTRGTMIVQQAAATSEKSSFKFQGRIDHVLTTDIAAKLDYSGSADPTLLKRFLPQVEIKGNATAAGVAEFTQKTFATRGKIAADQGTFEGWSASAVRAQYSYKYPENSVVLDSFSGRALGGNVTGKLAVNRLTETPHVAVDLKYQDVDSAQLARLYPWDSKYIVYSKLEGDLQGWLDGRGENFEFTGNTQLSSYPPVPTAGVVAFPTTGSLSFLAMPDEVEVKSSKLQFFDTTVQAEGRIHGRDTADLVVHLTSSNLANLHFLHKDANGSGSFSGTVKGSIQKPQALGTFALDQYKYKDFIIQHAQGTAALDMRAETANLTNVDVKIGDSTATVSGETSIDGSRMNLRVRSDHIRASDFAAAVTKEKIDGVLQGDVTVTSIDPVKVTGHVKATGLSLRGRTFEGMEGDLHLADPAVEILNLTASERGARLTGGTVRFNRSTEALDLVADVAALNLNRIRDLGVPDTVEGVLQRAHVTVGGTLQRPLINGNATVENLEFRGEVFPRAQLTMSTEWPNLTVVTSGMRNVDLTATINISAANYPFEARARFQNYSLEKVANFSHGTLTASGDAALSGQLRGQVPMAGSGTIRSIHARIGEYDFDGSKPFAFNFDAARLTLADDVSLNGQLGSKVNVRGSVGLTTVPKLDLTASGTLDLGVLAAVDPSWSITGTVKFDGRIGGTSVKPSIDGIASFANASLGREGIYTTLSMLNGDVRFSENRVTFDSLEGRVGGGTVRIRGTGLIQNNQMEGMNVRIELADQVRLRYPEGLRSSVTGILVVKGNSGQPLLDGDLSIASMTYRNDFESFLSLFRPGGLDSGGTALDRLKLSVHIAGNRNITIQNELVDISSARIDLNIKGSVGSPSLTGHVETSEGTLLFQGKRYNITRGNIDFVDPLRIDPVLDMQAETELRDYRVILAVNGRSDRVHAEFRSDPPLPQLELVSLIAGGKTLDELEAESGTTASLPTSEKLFQNGAASILVDLLKTRVGNRFGLLGLERVIENVKVDPYLGGSINNPAARVTVSEQVTKDLSVTYSQDLASNQRRIFQLEYFLTKNLSIVATREENNEATALGLDARWRKRF